MAKARNKSKVEKKSGAETNLVRRVTLKELAKPIPTFHSGDTVNVYVKVKEGEKERVQLYKGIVTKLQGSGTARSFTVRKISAGVGVATTLGAGLDAVLGATVGAGDGLLTTAVPPY